MRRYLLRFLASLAAVALTSCVEAPFERVNPNDPAVEFTMAIEASADTVTTNSRVVHFRLVTAPQVTGYEPAWSAEPSNIAVHVGGGTFNVVAGPTATITVTAAFLGRSASYVITRVP
jgi:hypothetical protein